MSIVNFSVGSDNAEIRFALLASSLGPVLVAGSDRGVRAILMGEDSAALMRDLQNRFPHAKLLAADGDFEEFAAKVVNLVEKPNMGLNLRLDVRGTAFQQRVWRELQKIPAGSTASYAEIARRIGLPQSVRAVAKACGANALAVAIPCHRVVKSDGAMSGYRWGVERKRALLSREACS
jgi:AraC family transcriptional regulator, regulatory protein of adaptative response / methylated-DNA-[protein]-cysteine methyltransferase